VLRGPYLNAVVSPVEEDPSCDGMTTPSHKAPVMYRASVASSSSKDAKRVPDISECRLLVLLLERDSLVSTEETEVIDTAGDLGLPMLCFYESEPGYVEDLITWKEAYPLAMANAVARPMTRFFPRDSADLCAHAVLQALKRTRLEQPLTLGIRVEHDDFSTIANLEDVRWLTPEFAMVMEPWSTDLPDTAYGQPGRARPYYISYTRSDMDKPGLSERQLARLRILLAQNTHEGQLLYIDSVSLTGAKKRMSLTEVSKFVEIMLLSEFIILDEVDPDAACKKPYLARGQCFMEAVIAVLTGNFLPTRSGHLDYLDTVLGRELASGTSSLREVVRKNAKSPAALINRLVGVLEKKAFAHSIEKGESCKLFAEMLMRHPHLADNRGKATRSTGFRSLGSRLASSASLVMKRSQSKVK